MARAHCPECNGDPEVRADGSYRHHRITPGIRSRTGWCPNGGRTVQVGSIPFVSDQEHGTRFPDVGAMHEPKPYTGELEWSDLASEYVD